jgi:hypothetical protein
VALGIEKQNEEKLRLMLEASQSTDAVVSALTTKG